MLNYFLILVVAFISMLTLHGQVGPAPSAQVELSSRNLIPGEQTQLIIRLQNARPDSRPAVPIIADTAVNFVRTVTQLGSQQRLTQIFVYRLTPAKPGKYTVPPVAMSSGGKQYAGQPLSFEVHDPAKLSVVPSGLPGNDVLLGWFPAKTTLYQGEQCPVTLKVYVPQELRLASWGLPEAEKKNCLAWRFSPPSSNNLGTVNIDNKAYLSAAYTTTMSGISPGTASLGPARLRVIVRQRTIDPRFGSRISDSPVNLTLPGLDFNILSLPEGAPADFKGAIGQFRIGAACPKKSLNDTDSVEVILQVAGTGNLENIQAPQLTGKGWKIIDTSKITRGGERRFVNGVVTFRQLLRPDRSGPLPTSIPPYSFSFFNPHNQSYYTLNTSAIPVSITSTLPANKGSHAGAMTSGELTETSPEEMRNILGFIEQPSSEKPTIFSKPSRYWQLIPALLCLIIIAVAIIRKVKAAASRHPDEHHKRKALKKLTGPADTLTFYRRSGRFIEQWLTPNEELNAILAERDELCFLPDGAQATPLSEQRKKEITKLLRHHSKLSLILLLATLTTLTTLTTPIIQAAPNNELGSTHNAWQKGDYQQAIDHYLKQYPDPSNTPADILYNIGNCHYRLDQPGHAALAWRRALAQQPNHAEARQNLRFVELEQGSITPKLEPWQQQLTTLPLQLYHAILQASLWLLLITILILTLIRPKRTTALVVLSIITPLTASIGALGSYYYPDTARQTPFQKQAVCLVNTPMYNEAHRQSSTLTTLFPASLVTISATRGRWCHIQTADGQTGWVNSRFIPPVLLHSFSR